jgi:L-alanine-DL-glutamate epimerase-like enolase superfamily enzyme
MKVTAVETIRTSEFPNLLWVQVHTNEGLIGLGETFKGPAAAEGHIHGMIAPYLLGKDPRAIEAHQAHLAGYVGFVVARATRCPIAVGETRGGRGDFRALLELDALAMVIMDISWGGGVSEARKLAGLAEAWHVPVAFHDCTGPVGLTVATHLALHARNCWVQEIVRAFCTAGTTACHRAAADRNGEDHGGPAARWGSRCSPILSAARARRCAVPPCRTCRVQ